MGKGDQRTRTGKIWRGTFGKTRPRLGRKRRRKRQQEAPAAETKGS